MKPDGYSCVRRLVRVYGTGIGRQRRERGTASRYGASRRDAAARWHATSPSGEARRPREAWSPALLRRSGPRRRRKNPSQVDSSDWGGPPIGRRRRSSAPSRPSSPSPTSCCSSARRSSALPPRGCSPATRRGTRGPKTGASMRQGGEMRKAFTTRGKVGLAEALRKRRGRAEMWMAERGAGSDDGRLG